jgi:uncharacterized membrane protein
MSQPKITIIPKPVDRIMDFAIISGMVLLIILPLYYFPKLPETVPIHYNFWGEADGFGNKNTLLILPPIGLLVGLILLWINKYPHIFNFPVEVNSKNARHLYTLGQRMIRIMNIVTIIIFIYLSYCAFNYKAPNVWFNLIPFLVGFVIPGIAIYKMFKLK